MRTRTRKVLCGEDMRWREEHAGVARFRYRRLLAFLWLQGFESTFQSMLDQTTDFFCVEHLERLVSKGQWEDAEFYVSPRFVRTDDRTCPVSVEAHVLVNFLRMHRLIYSQQASRANSNLNWGRVWSKAAEIVRVLANRTPELKELLLLPDGPMGPRDVLPIGFGSASFRRRRHPKKRARRPHPSAIAKLYLDKMRSLPASSECSSQLLSPPGMDQFRASNAFDWLGHLLEECRQAGKIPKIYQGCPLQSTAKEGAPVSPLPQTMFGNLTNPSKVSGIASVTDTCAAVADSVIDPRLLGPISD